MEDNETGKVLYDMGYGACEIDFALCGYNCSSIEAAVELI
jgi:hypothetical protein